MRVFNLGSNLRDEKGVILPIVAVILLGLILFFIALGVDTGRTRIAAMQLRGALDSLCRSMAYDPGGYTDARNEFLDGVNKIEDAFPITVVSSRLIIPTMPGDGSFAPPGGQAGVPFVDRLPSQGQVRDYFYGDVTHPDLDDRFPEGIWSNLFNAGNLIACEIEATIDVFFAGLLPGLSLERDIQARSVFYRPVNSWTDFNYYDHQFETLPALTIAVATQMQTDPGDDRFRFNENHPYYGPGNYGSYDPFSFPLNAALPFSQNSGGHIVSNEYVPDFYQSFQDDVVIKVIEPFVGNNLDEMLAACMNPAALVRNVFLSTIVELAARHGQLRMGTEVLHLNPRTVIDEDSNFMPPVRMVEFEQDLLASDYQLPYVFYRAGGVGDDMLTGFQAKSPHNDYDVNVVLNPFNVAEEPIFDPPFENYADFLQHHALVASQIRICHHLFDRDRERVKPFEHAAIEWADPGGEGFYPSIYAARTEGIDPPVPDSWDGNEPWDTGGACFDCLTAPELVYSLGTTQSCPITGVTHPGASVPPGPGGNYCNRPTGQDLVPDYRGLVEYVVGEGMAFKTPGLFPLDVEDGSYGFKDGTYFVEDAVSSENKNHNSHVLIVVHQAPAQEEIGHIRGMIDTFDGLGRPFTIVYIPIEDSFAAIEDGIRKLEEAFRASRNWKPGGESETSNLVVPITPFLERYDPDHTDPEMRCDPDWGYCWPWQPDPISDPALLIDFWHYLLHRDKLDSIEREAQFIFLNRILNVRLKL